MLVLFFIVGLGVVFTLFGYLVDRKERGKTIDPVLHHTVESVYLTRKRAGEPDGARKSDRLTYSWSLIEERVYRKDEAGRDLSAQIRSHHLVNGTECARRVQAVGGRKEQATSGGDREQPV